MVHLRKKLQQAAKSRPLGLGRIEKPALGHAILIGIHTDQGRPVLVALWAGIDNTLTSRLIVPAKRSPKTGIAKKTDLLLLL